MRRPILLGIAVAFLIALVPAVATAATIPPPPYQTAEACLACHAVANSGPVIHTVDFAVAAVDRNACNKCHWISGHPSHSVGGDCTYCHSSWPQAGSIPWVSAVQTPFGFFNSAASATSTDAAYLHQVHSRRSWPADVTSREQGCGSCHAPAACDACHGSVAHDSHPTQNGNPAPAAPYAATTRGAPVNAFSFPALDTFGFVSCAAADCHAGIGAERITEDSDPSVVTAGSWTVRTSAQTGLGLLGGSALYTTSVGASLTVPFVGNQVSVWGATGQFSGAVDIYVDGVYQLTKDFFEYGVFPTNGIWTSGDYGPGPHALTLVVADGRSLYGNDVYFDRIVARDLVAPTDTAPTCLTCHAARAAEHGYDAFDHTADETATTDPALAGKTCGSCHSMDLSTAHALVGACEVCHSPVSAGSTLTAEGTINPDHVPGRWDQRCEACHNAANPVLAADKHTGLAAHETTGVAADAECLGCHGATSSLLPTIHVSAETTVDVGGTPTHLTGCDVCHANPTLTRPLTNVCSNCHFTMDAHPGADHTSAYKMNDCAASGCHKSVKVVSSTETTQDLVAIHNDFRTFACGECHGMDNARYKAAIAAGDKNCTACHDDPGNHAAVHVLDPPLVDASGPHYAYGSGSMPGGTYTEDCALCHTSNLVDEHVGGNGRIPRYRPDGTALGCADCHASTDLKVQLAIQKGSGTAGDFAACDDCHIAADGTPIHQQMATVHLSPFAGIATEGTSDLTAVHVAVTTTPPGGRALSGCEVCHSYFTKYDTAESQMGTRTQTAIAAGVADCTACHTTSMMGAKHVAPDSAACTKCHAESVTALHAASRLGGCSVCHNNPLDPDKVAGMTNANCAQSGCHTTEGTDYHTQMNARHASPTNATCFGAGCHDASRDLRQVHAGYAGTGAEFSQYADACDMCHTNPRIDWTTPTSARCVDKCHSSNHQQMKTKHAPTSASDACTACHGKDIVASHGAYADLARCDLCHADPKVNWNRSIDCATCHDTKFPPETQHYSDTTHTATPFTAAAQGAVAAGGEECASCHSPILPPAHSAAATDGVQLTCVGCHMSPSFESSRVVSANWPNKTCVACHDRAPAGSTTHAQYGTAHVVVANGCAGSGSGCHASTDLAALHANGQNGGAAKFNSCYNADPNDPTACHATKDMRPAAFPIADSCGTGSAGCHQDKGTGTHGTHDLNVTGSDYSNASVAGCTNSGAGCHGAETRPTPNYQAPYHPGTACADSKCHTSASFATHDNPLACQDCHDGTYTSAPNVKTLTAVTAAGGHYNETTHTAAAADRSGTVSSGGTVSAACADCHDDTPVSGLKGIYAQHQSLPAPYGDTTCADCHDYSAGVSAVVKASWTNDACADCHNEVAMGGRVQHGTTAPVVLGTSVDGCGASGTGCHNSYDLHELHKGRTGGKVDTCALSGCHDYGKQGLKPTGKTCGTGGACHGTITPATHGAHTVNLTTSDYNDTAVTGCTNSGAGCHGSETRPTPNYQAPYHPGTACGTSKCHTSASFATHTNPLACQDCHDGTYTSAPNVKTLTALSTSGGHYNETTHTAAPTDRTGVVGSGGTVTAKCTDCHANVPATGLKQLYAQHQSLPAPYGNTTCADCHDYSAGVSAEVKASWTNDKCADCHNATDMPGLAQHATTAPAVLGTSADGCGASGTSCHSTYDLHALHKGKTGGKVTTCALSGCHDYGKQGLKPAGKTCGTGGACHNSGDPHIAHRPGTVSAGCVTAGCHDKSKSGVVAPGGDLMILHAARPEGKCAVCHASPKTTPPTDLTTGKTTFDCQQSGCHGDVTANHKAMHDTTGVVDAGCKGCHFVNVVDEHNALGYTCDTCHRSTNASVIAAIAGSSLDCDGCHPAVNGKNRHASQNATEFVAENASGHRVDDTLPWMRTSYTVNGATYTWPAPTNFFKSGWTATSVVTCDKCHTVSATAAGPHGASVAVNIDPVYTGDWHTATLRNGTTSSTLLCTKCHNLNVNDVHNAGDHDGYLCIDCHARVPHGWRLPRLLAYTTDPPAYKSNHLTSIRLKSYTPNNWSESDCGQSGCEEHNSLVSPKWPSAPMVVAQIAGRITDSSTATGVPGVTVTLSTGQSTTANHTGYYLFEGLGTGAYTITVSATGYVGQSATLDVTSSDDYVKDFVITQGSTATNVAIDKPASATSQYSSTYSASKAVDGSTSTYWRSSSTGNQNLTVDLGGPHDLTKAVINWNGSYYARAYTVQVSTDNSSWTTVATVTSNTSGTDTHTFTARARYIRLASTSAYSSSYRVNEFEAWGAPVPTGTISGTVTSGSSPVSGATVSGDGLTATTDAGGNYTITGVTAGTYSLTASKTGYTSSAAKPVTVAGGATTDADFSLTAAPVSTNVALAGAFTASSQYSSSYTAERAGDGSYSTYWRSHSLSYSSATEWLQVDLGSAMAIGKLVVGWNNQSYSANDYQVQYASSAGGPWTTIPNGTVSNSTSTANRTFTLATPVTARFWRVYCTGYNNSSGYRIYEFETWTP